jgi:hypothetical protein
MEDLGALGYVSEQLARTEPRGSAFLRERAGEALSNDAESQRFYEQRLEQAVDACRDSVRVAIAAVTTLRRPSRCGPKSKNLTSTLSGHRTSRFCPAWRPGERSQMNRRQDLRGGSGAT